ncbi:pyridoxamine 5'-phosphate oxidase family protein [Streptomyces rubradiris]|uniref:Pyridoxamine 5'-phosphate oxidase n=1 Tax=Streptomyces rubradiris TaxID=285531 RepID=A0ABQ3RKB1_STRRR|nr:pyridoxamine 5'-phosphate oxidase family protein [Streptomyces rubradiris]GHH27712.1 pyridoxamine 5'-phosphate oxidase [Streptomyces rubradiris]GHI56305.1 pyridoxamine 5'-phosphate oxidase [Streptomyces rubradiris]
MGRFAHLAYTDSVRRVQEEQGSGLLGVRALAQPDTGPDELGPDEAAFLTSRDGFYLASTGETGWPYIQFRGGPAGFVHVLDERRLAWAEVRGNRQYITTGNLRTDGRVALFFMDYARQARLKLLGRARTQGLDEDAALTERLGKPRTDGKVERLMIVEVEGFNWNCHQHITPRYSEEELETALRPVRARMDALEQENARLRARLAELGEAD